MYDIIRDDNATIVDVRTVEEFEMGNVDNSLNIPMHVVPLKIDEFKEMQKPVVLICASGNRSGQVARYLSSQGIDEVYNGGGWVEVMDILEA